MPASHPLCHPAPCALLLLVLGLAAGCDRREEGVEGDLSPETGLTTPAPQETPPSDPASGSATTGPDDAARSGAAQDAAAREQGEPAPER